jgi:uncharacterized protein YecE (DUF72 family)
MRTSVEMAIAPSRIRIGVQGFSPKDWVGTFYPPGFTPRQFLPFYAQVFDTVELNATFYAIPSASTVRAWATRTPPDFIFTAKMPQDITHDRRLLGSEEKVSVFLDMMSLLGDKLGPIVIQFPRSFTRRFEENLRAFLPLLPRDIRFAIEFRSQSWNDEGVFELLRQFDVAWCINAWQDLPPVIETTTNFAYLRLVGFHREFSHLGRVQRDRSQELASWATTIGDLTGKVNRTYIYVNNHYAGHAPATVNQLQALLGLPSVEPRSLWPERPSLFDGPKQ